MRISRSFVAGLLGLLVLSALSFSGWKLWEAMLLNSQADQIRRETEQLKQKMQALDQATKQLKQKTQALEEIMDSLEDVERTLDGLESPAFQETRLLEL